MTTSDDFKAFLASIRITNDQTISARYGEITKALNKEFRNTDSTTANSLQVGSYGRKTGIKGISDLDILYIMPKSSWDDFKNGGQSRLLQKCCKAISDRYKTTTVKVDRLVVQVEYQNFKVEVQPVYEQEDGSYKYPDTYQGGSWKFTKPRAEMNEMNSSDDKSNGNLRHLCKMVRAWKNKHGVGIGGLVIDTFVHRFFQQSDQYDEVGYEAYGELSRDFFEFLAGQPKVERINALGSGQHVKIRGAFRRKAREAFDLCEDAIEDSGNKSANEKWRSIFGRGYPSATSTLAKAQISEGIYQYNNTEEFVEDLFPIDVRYSLLIDCEVTQPGFRTFKLLEMLGAKLPLFTHKSLRFYVRNHNIPGNFSIWWKVLNRGDEAKRRNKIRGQIILDKGKLSKTENTNFRGNHIVECYATKNGVVIARDEISVPIVEGED